MGYIQDREHFRRYLEKAARNSGIDSSQMYPFEFYKQNIWDAGVADLYTWKLKLSAEWLTRCKVREFLAQINSPEFSWPYKWDRLCLSEDFTGLLEDVYNRSGVYLFEAKDGQSLYVGRSTSNLQSRIATSFMERFDNYNEQVFVKIALCNPSDTALLEVYLITTLKPILNRDCRYEDTLTLTVSGIPPFIQPVPCFGNGAFNSGG